MIDDRDEMGDKEDQAIDEAGWSNAKMAQSQASNDSWKAAQKLAKDLQPAGKPASWKKEPERELELDPGSGETPKLATEMGTGGIAGFQAPPISDEERMKAVREMIKQRVKEVVRKKAGGGGFTLYGPNKGKKGKPKPVGSFPTKIGAKRAELARYPPKDQGKLKRLRKEVDKLAKDPKKTADKEKKAAKAKGTDKGAKKEGLVREAPGAGTPFASTAASKPMSMSGGTQASSAQLSQDVPSFLKQMTSIKDKKQLSSFVMSHMQDDSKSGFLQSKLVPYMRQVASKKFPNDQAKSNQFVQSSLSSLHNIAKGTPSAATAPTQAQASEAVARRMDFMERVILSKVITKSLTESLFREEATESEWDDYIGKLSKNALAGDGKFQTLQKNISRKTDDILEDAFDTIKKAVGKNVKMKSYGIKHEPSKGKTYLAFSASFEDISVEPMYIHVEGGVPKIELSSGAKVALTKADPDQAKLFRAELVTVQERVLDNMEDLSKAIQNRDKYLQKMENEVDGYVAGLSPLQISLLKQLLVKKYRKIS